MIDTIKESFREEEHRETFRKKVLPRGRVPTWLHLVVDKKRINVREEERELDLEEGQTVTLILLRLFQGGAFLTSSSDSGVE